MTILESFMVGVFGLGVVFLVLVALSLVIMLQSRIFRSLKIGKKEKPQKQAEPVETAEKKDAGITAGELKLFNVDDKTAAIIMAIVSHESKIPLPELQFKSIKALN